MTQPVTTAKSAAVYEYLFEWMTRTSPKVRNVPLSFRFDIERIVMRMSHMPAADQILQTKDSLCRYVETFLREECPEKIFHVNVQHEIERLLRD